MPLLILALLLAAGPARAEDAFGEIKVDASDLSRAKKERAQAAARAQEAPDPVTPAEEKPPPAVSGEADLSLFFQRLEDVGLDTQFLRALAKDIEVFFRAPGGDALAEWGFFTDNLYIPDGFKEKDSSKVRYDLDPQEIDTFIHEFTHAARDLKAREDAPKGSAAQVHYDAVFYIRAELRSRAALYSYSWMKADETSGYFMGAAIAKVLEAAREIAAYNTGQGMGGTRAASPQEAERLGGVLLLPDRAASDNFSKFFWKRFAEPFANTRGFESAMFKSGTFSGPEKIGWEGNPWIQQRMFDNILGLKPPKDVAELLDRLNRIDNAWIRAVRAQALKARRESAQKASARLAPLDAPAAIR